MQRNRAFRITPRRYLLAIAAVYALVFQTIMGLPAAAAPGPLTPLCSTLSAGGAIDPLPQPGSAASHACQCLAHSPAASILPGVIAVFACVRYGRFEALTIPPAADTPSRTGILAHAPRGPPAGKA